MSKMRKQKAAISVDVPPAPSVAENGWLLAKSSSSSLGFNQPLASSSSSHADEAKELQVLKQQIAEYQRILELLATDESLLLSTDVLSSLVDELIAEIAVTDIKKCLHEKDLAAFGVRDIFGTDHHATASLDKFTCPSCNTIQVAANFAKHLEKCSTTRGRASTRIASQKITDMYKGGVKAEPVVAAAAASGSSGRKSPILLDLSNSLHSHTQVKLSPPPSSSASSSSHPRIQSKSEAFVLDEESEDDDDDDDDDDSTFEDTKRRKAANIRKKPNSKKPQLPQQQQMQQQFAPHFGAHPMPPQQQQYYPPQQQHFTPQQQQQFYNHLQQQQQQQHGGAVQYGQATGAARPPPKRKLEESSAHPLQSSAHSRPPPPRQQQQQQQQQQYPIHQQQRSQHLSSHHQQRQQQQQQMSMLQAFTYSMAPHRADEEDDFDHVDEGRRPVDHVPGALHF